MRHIRKRFASRFALPAVAAIVTLTGWGCSTPLVEQFRDDPSPELASVGLRQGQIENKIAINQDEGFRSAYTDVLRFWLLIDRRHSSVIPVP